MTIKLDNPVWYSLLETNKDICLDYGHIKFYDPGYCPFGAFENSRENDRFMDQYSELTDNFYIVGAKPEFSKNLRLKHELVCLQMILDQKMDNEIRDTIVRLNGRRENDLFNLVNLVQPGFFKRRTAMMGDYFGIFSNHELVAVTGERMKMNGYTEVSAVVTHPQHTGKGYAKQLIAHTVNRIFDMNKIPYLHVSRENKVAINLYEKCGFTTRTSVSFWNLEKIEAA